MKTICMKCHILFFRKSKKNIPNLSSADLAQRVLKVKDDYLMIIPGLCSGIFHKKYLVYVLWLLVRIASGW